MSVGPTGELGKEILRIREWISDTTTGDRDDLVPGVSDRAWHHASVAKPECLGKHCPLIDECFAQAARLEAADADVVVTNHSLFGINACGEGELFGEYDAVVIDEAHELADRVRSQAAADLTVARVSRVARSLRSNLSIDSTDLDEAGAGLGAAMAPLEAGLLEYRPSALIDAMVVLDGAARRASHEVSDAQGEPAAKLLARAAIDELIAALEAWGRDPDQSIAYITKDESDNARLTVGPLDVSAAIGGTGIGERPAILTSATLALGGNFDFMAAQSGMAVSGVPWHGIDVGSPFDHARQGIRYVATHLPLPGRDGPCEELLDELVELAQASGGGMLALFASKRGAMAGAQALRERTDLTVYLQGEETLAQLIQRFREERDSCPVAGCRRSRAGLSTRRHRQDSVPAPRRSRVPRPIHGRGTPWRQRLRIRLSHARGAHDGPGRGAPSALDRRPGCRRDPRSTRGDEALWQFHHALPACHVADDGSAGRSRCPASPRAGERPRGVSSP